MSEKIDASTIVAVVRKLTGPIKPVGDSAVDASRMANIKCFSGVVLDLLYDLMEIRWHNLSHEASVAAVGKYADDTIGIIKENIEEKP